MRGIQLQQLASLLKLIQDSRAACGFEGDPGCRITVQAPEKGVNSFFFKVWRLLIYVAEGSLTLDVAGKGKMTLKKSESLLIARGVVHQAFNPSLDTPFKAVTFGIFEKGKPDTTVVGE